MSQSPNPSPSAYSYEQLSTDFSDVFGTKQLLNAAWLKKLQHNGWLGLTCTPLRAVSWRVLLGLLPVDLSEWHETLEQHHESYEALKKAHLPDINQVNVDPLSGMCSTSEENDEGQWDTYYKKLDTVKFIQGDLERLYLNGVEGEYFQESFRAKMLLNVLFVWAEENDSTSGYRQGMHEIAAPVLLALESESSLWSAALSSKSASPTTDVDGPDPAIAACFSEGKYIESSLYWLFEKIMQDLEYLYKPPSQPGDIPGVVSFCTQVQEEMLRALDPDLCYHLEENYVQAQLYGMRWSRLLLGREFEAVNDGLFRIWDYIFASSLDVAGMEHFKEHKDDKTSLESKTHDDPLLNTPTSHSGNISENDMDVEWMTSSAAMKARRKAQYSRPYPILESLADFMLAMLLHIREDLLSGDNSSTLQLLMRYPAIDDITPIIDLADMIRRGVLDSNSHVGAIANTDEGNFSADEGATKNEGTSKSHTPTWLWRDPTGIHADKNGSDTDSAFSIRKNLRGVTRKMSHTFNSVLSTPSSETQDQLANDNLNNPPRRKTSIGTRNILFGAARRGSKGRSNPLFDDQVDGHSRTSLDGESMVVMDKNSSHDHECEDLVKEDLNRIASFLESWTADVSRKDPAEVMPDIISRLRLLGGVLDHSVSPSDFTDMTAESELSKFDRLQVHPDTNVNTSMEENVSNEALTEADSMHVVTNKNNLPDDSSSTDITPDCEPIVEKKDVFGKEYFADMFGLHKENDNVPADKIPTDESRVGPLFSDNTLTKPDDSLTDDVKINTLFDNMNTNSTDSSIDHSKKNPLPTDISFTEQRTASDDAVMKTKSESIFSETSPTKRPDALASNAKIDAIFSDLTGSTKLKTEKSPFDDPF